MSQYEQFFADWLTTQRTHPEWRRGQAAFNCLASNFPELAEKVSGSLTVDPFHDDSKLDAFFIYISKYMSL